MRQPRPRNPRKDRHPSRLRALRPWAEFLEDRVQLSLVVSGTEFHVDTTTTGRQDHPAIAMDSSGDEIVVWASQEGQSYSTMHIRAQRYHLVGGVFQPNGAEFQVDKNGPGPRNNPSVAMDNNGDFVIVWQSAYEATEVNNDYGIFAQVYNSAGTAKSASDIHVNSIITGRQNVPKVGMSSTGEFAVTWQSNTDSFGDFVVEERRFNFDGTAVDAADVQVNTLANSNASSGEGTPAIAMDPNGDYVIAWADSSEAGANNGIFAQRYTLASGAVGANFAVSTFNSPSDIDPPQNPAVAIDQSNGDFVIAWQAEENASGQLQETSTTAGDDGFGIFATLYSSSGTPVTGAQNIHLNHTLTNTQSLPSVSINNADDFFVTWESVGQGIDSAATSQTNIYGQRVNSFGALIGATEPLVNSTQSGFQNEPAVASDPLGDTIVAWSTDQGVNHDTNADAYEIYAQRYLYVNDAPTLNSISNLTINENAGQQIINLTGVSTGGGTAASGIGETQTLTPSATSNNTGLIPNPVVTLGTNANGSYTGGGTLSFTPVAGAFGTATITVSLSDNGGTANGGTNSIQRQFTVTVNQVASTVTSVGVIWGLKSATLSVDNGTTLLPAGRTTDIPWLGINQLSVILSQAATVSPSDVSVTGVNVATYGPVTIAGSGTTNISITLNKPISQADRVTITIGNAGLTTYTRRLDVLPGDLNDNGVVDASDAVGTYYATAAPYNVFADIDGNGVVDLNDVTLVRQRAGTHF